MSQYISDELIKEAFRSLQNDNARLKVELVVLQKELAEAKAPIGCDGCVDENTALKKTLAEVEANGRCLRDELVRTQWQLTTARTAEIELEAVRGCLQPETDRQKRAEKLLAWAEAKTEPSHGDRFVWELRQAAGLK